MPSSYGAVSLLHLAATVPEAAASRKGGGARRPMLPVDAAPGGGGGARQRSGMQPAEHSHGRRAEARRFLLLEAGRARRSLPAHGQASSHPRRAHFSVAARFDHQFGRARSSPNSIALFFLLFLPQHLALPA